MFLDVQPQAFFDKLKSIFEEIHWRFKSQSLDISSTTFIVTYPWMISKICPRN